MRKLAYIPYFQTTRYRVDTMIELAQIKPGELAADLGSGDGRIVAALAQAGAIAHGYELDTTLIAQSEKLLKDTQLARQAKIIPLDFWTQDLRKYAVITVYPMPDIMEPLEQKLQNELLPGTRVLLNYYPFPTWQFTTIKNNIYLYRK